MRTKTLIVAAALTAAGLASSLAQSNVYSLNVVGYYNVIVPATKLQLVANQFVVTNLDVSAIIPATTPGLADGDQLFKWTGASFGVISTYEDPGGGGEWSTPVAMNRGEGFFFKNVSGTPVTLTFVGEVPQGSLTNALPTGKSIRASVTPQGGGISTALGLPKMSDGTQVLQWSPAAGNYNPINTFEVADESDPGAWNTSEPQLTVGVGFFLNNTGPATNWVRNFTVQ